jgi:hypothetical protein
MRLPKDLIEREYFVNDLIQKCQVSVEARRADYSSLRSFYLFGAGPEESPAQFNKIYPTIDQLISFLYAADTTRFTINLGSTAPKFEYEKLTTLVESLNDKWTDSGGDKAFLSAITWALCFNSCFIKLVWRDGVHPYVVVPASMGVLREDIASTDRQEAVVQSYYITKSDLYARLYSHPKRDEIIKRIESAQHEVEHVPAAVDRIVLSQTNPTIYGTVNLDLYGFNRMKAEVAEDTVEMRELWVWNDEEDDYQVITVADPNVIVYDRPGKELYLKGELPFIQVCPYPQIDYYWGQSGVQKLILLQQMRNKRVTEILDLLSKQVNPPTFLTGISGIQDERDFALNRPGGLMSSDMPNSDIKRLAPDMPDDLFREVREIDAMFEEASGIGAVLSGRGEQGVRSSGHASQLARLGSSRAKKAALVIEDSLARVATQYMKLLQQHDATHYTDDKGNKFVLEQFTKDYSVKVDAHSNSPIFMEDMRTLAFELLKAGAIDKESLLDLLDPPMKQLLKRRLKLMQEAQAKEPPPPADGGMKSIQGGKRG